jgi:hypothetical protein
VSEPTVIATRRRTTAAIVVILVMLAGAGGCRDTAAARAQQARAREWTALQLDEQKLDAERAALAQMRGRLASAPIAADGTPIRGTDAALARDVAARENDLRARASSLGDRLVRYLAALDRSRGNDDPEWKQAVRLKSDEDLAVAQEWIDRGGDYRRAIEILETQRALDPDYPRLEQALARARDMRFVTPERFARVQEGMTPVDVRAALGPVNLREVLRRPAERLEAWYYPKRAGGKAAVYFRYDDTKRGFVVYQTELAAGAARPPSSSLVS